METLDSTTLQRISAIIASHGARPGPLLLVLHDVQNTLGCIPPAAIPHIASALNLTRAEVHGVISFYHHFRSEPPGRHSVRICRAESCQAMNGEALAAHARERLGIDFHRTTPDGQFTLESVYCLGNCACSPAMMIDDDLYGRVTPEDLDALLAERSRR